MAVQLLSIPIGQIGQLVISESAGVISVQGDVALVSNAIKVGFKVEGGVPALLKLAAQNASNPIVKSLMNEVASAAQMLP